MTGDDELFSDLPTASVSFSGCTVIAGDWYSTYDNQNIADPP